MPFPEAPRVIYNKNPLDKVICQLKFPPILKIDTEVPDKFQERIRDEFPEFSEKAEIKLPIFKSAQKNTPTEVLQSITPTGNKNYEFSSEDKVWTINLTRTFIALSTNKYKRREEFRKHLNVPLKALIDIYKPSAFSRVGLRYIDIIRRSELKLGDAPWSELLKSHVLWLLSSSDVNKNIRSFQARCEIELDDEISIARVMVGLVDGQESDEECFMIDTDFLTTKKTAIVDVDSKLDYFHIQGSRLIQWLITERLHKAMEPEEL